MKSKNTKRLTFTLSTLCLVTTLFCSANAHIKTEKATVAMATVSPKAASSENDLDTLVHTMHAQAKASRHARNNVADAALHYGDEDVRLMKALLHNSSFYEINLAMGVELPEIARALNNTLAYYQRQRTNILLAHLVAKQHETATKTSIPFSTGKNALLLYTPNGKTIPFFQFVHDFHAQAYVQQCMIPLIRHGNVTLHRLNLTKNIFGFLGSHGDDNAFFHLHHCRSRSEKWNRRLYASNLYAVHDAALLAAANYAANNRYHDVVSTPVSAAKWHTSFSSGKNAWLIHDKITRNMHQRVNLTLAIAAQNPRFQEAIAAWALHPTNANTLAFLKMQRHYLQQKNIDTSIRKATAYINSHNMLSNDAALAAMNSGKRVEPSHVFAPIQEGKACTHLLSPKKTQEVMDAFFKHHVVPAYQPESTPHFIREKVSNVVPTKTEDNASQVETTDLDKFFNSLGYSNNATSPEVYKRQAAGYYSGSKPIQEMDIDVPPYSASNGGIGVFNLPIKKGGKTA